MSDNKQQAIELQAQLTKLWLEMIREKSVCQVSAPVPSDYGVETYIFGIKDDGEMCRYEGDMLIIHGGKIKTKDDLAPVFIELLSQDIPQSGYILIRTEPTIFRDEEDKAWKLRARLRFFKRTESHQLIGIITAPLAGRILSHASVGEKPCPTTQAKRSTTRRSHPFERRKPVESQQSSETLKSATLKPSGLSSAWSAKELSAPRTISASERFYRNVRSKNPQADIRPFGASLAC